MEKRHKRNRIGNDEKLDRKILLEDESDGEQNKRLNDWKLYGEKQQHDLSKTLPRNEMKDLKS